MKDLTIFEALKADILPLIQPSKEENQKLSNIFEILKQNLLKFSEKLNIAPIFIENHGSTGIKQTHLKGTSDLDIFVGLDPSDYSAIIKMPSRTRKKALKELFLSYVKDWFIPAAKATGYNNYLLSYAEHPYLMISQNGYEIDIVGCFDLNYDYLLEHGPITAVDRTPWHSKIISERLSETQKNDVRLFKKFLQTNFVYGDKNTLGRLGFTGFSSEILIIHFNNLETVFSELKNLEQSALDYFKRPAKQLRKSDRFKNDHLIIIDPVDKNRNLASSISERAYKYACYQIDQFYKAYSSDFFLKEPITTQSPKKLTQISPNLVLAEINNEQSIHYTEVRDKLYSTCDKLRKILETEPTGEKRFGNVLFEVYFEERTFITVFYCELARLDATYDRRGPPKHRTTNVDQFCRRHPQAFYKDGYYYVSVKRAYRQPLPLISEFLQNSKQLEGLKIGKISQKPSSRIEHRAVSLMLSCILPLYGMINP